MTKEPCLGGTAPQPYFSIIQYPGRSSLPVSPEEMTPLSYFTNENNGVGEELGEEVREKAFLRVQPGSGESVGPVIPRPHKKVRRPVTASSPVRCLCISYETGISQSSWWGGPQQKPLRDPRAKENVKPWRGLAQGLNDTTRGLYT